MLLHQCKLWWLLDRYFFLEVLVFLKRTQRSSLLNANRPEWDNCQNILFLLYYFAKVLQIRIDEIVHKMLLK